MSKIRINELARELEVKPSVIIDLLPELGVAEKKTHSSSLDDDVALEVRRRLGEGTVPADVSASNGSGAVHAEPEPPPPPAPVVEAAPVMEAPPAPPRPAAKVEPPPAPSAPAAPEPPKETQEAPAA